MNQQTAKKQKEESVIEEIEAIRRNFNYMEASIKKINAHRDRLHYFLALEMGATEMARLLDDFTRYLTNSNLLGRIGRVNAPLGELIHKLKEGISDDELQKLIKSLNEGLEKE